SWPFMRSGERWDFVIEPVVTAAYASENAADPRIVNEDSLGFELDNTSLFRPNGAPNYDLWEPGGRISAGIRATARARTGQTASLVFGRRWREEPAPGFTPRSNLNQQASDYVGSVNVNLGRVFSTDARFRLDSETLAVQRIDLGVSGAISRFSLGARYYRIEESFAPGLPNEQVSFMGGVDLARGWRLTGFVNRDLQTDINLRQGVSAIYEDDCTFLEIAYTRTETQIGTLGPDESIQIRIGLRSLGVFSGQ
ncbi:MAG: LPS assembly protein LptD, partial [Hyphomonadaceae bacterium]|nr:LPS assembly protein LptD [Hyphomonadaceae bacterium]